MSLYLFVKKVTTDYSNYRCISLVRTTNKIFSNILLSRLTKYVHGHVSRSEWRTKAQYKE
jgi:hypothetical protein